MTAEEFRHGIESRADLEWRGVRGDDRDTAEALIRVRMPGAEAITWAIRVADIPHVSWAEVEGVLFRTRSPRVLTHITRIVGYFSQVHNWNRSKLAELRDRRKGNYAVAV